ncbi:MAG TPA: hypothetical protein VLE20_06930 [Blastocatellia bacterium]|nr:hypothetical protein [Blastocatellia bacterium]
MLRIVPLLMIALLVVGCADKGPAPAAKRVEKDPKVAAAEEKIAKTTPEGKAMIEKAQAMKAEVNEQPSGKTIKEIADGWTNNQGAYNISVIGWEASQKKPFAGEKTGRWKIVFHYQDYQKQQLAAEWEYNPETNKLYPFELTNAPQFWTAPEAASQGKKGKK